MAPTPQQARYIAVARLKQLEDYTTKPTLWPALSCDKHGVTITETAAAGKGIVDLGTVYTTSTFAKYIEEEEEEEEEEEGEEEEEVGREEASGAGKADGSPARTTKAVIPAVLLKKRQKTYPSKGAAAAAAAAAEDHEGETAAAEEGGGTLEGLLPDGLLTDDDEYDDYDEYQQDDEEEEDEEGEVDEGVRHVEVENHGPHPVVLKRVLTLPIAENPDSALLLAGEGEGGDDRLGTAATVSAAAALGRGALVAVAAEGVEEAEAADTQTEEQEAYYEEKEGDRRVFRPLLSSRGVVIPCDGRPVRVHIRCAHDPTGCAGGGAAAASTSAAFVMRWLLFDFAVDETQGLSQVPWWAAAPASAAGGGGGGGGGVSGGGGGGTTLGLWLTTAQCNRSTQRVPPLAV